MNLSIDSLFLANGTVHQPEFPSQSTVYPQYSTSNRSIPTHSTRCLPRTSCWPQRSPSPRTTTKDLSYTVLSRSFPRAAAPISDVCAPSTPTLQHSPSTSSRTRPLPHVLATRPLPPTIAAASAAYDAARPLPSFAPPQLTPPASRTPLSARPTFRSPRSAVAAAFELQQLRSASNTLPAIPAVPSPFRSARRVPRWITAAVELQRLPCLPSILFRPQQLGHLP